MVVFINFSLVEKVINHYELFSVGFTKYVQILVDVDLSQRNCILEVYKIILIEHIITFLVHSFNDVFSHNLLTGDLLLGDTLLHILIKVPGDHRQDIFIMIFGHDLKPVLVEGGDNF